MRLENVKILKMGSRLGIALSEFYFEKGSIVEIKALKGNNQKTFLAKFNRIITLRRDLRNFLGLKHQELLTLEIRSIPSLERTKEMFKDDKIDMLSLIPEKTSKDYEIFVVEFDKDAEKWVRIWYSHERGSGQQLEIKRYVEIEAIGSLLGQYQAEGTKHKNTSNKFYIEFKNKLVLEHKEFVNSLNMLGITKNMSEFRFVFNLVKVTKNEVENYVNQFKTGMECDVKLSSCKSKGIGFGWVIRNTLLAEIVLNSLDKVRNLLVRESHYLTNQQKLANSFFAKLLTGDGTFDVNCRGRDFPGIRIKIVDIDINYLHDYKKIMKNLGFHARINEKYIFVISSCSFKNLLYLYRINAFKNSNNWNKLIVAIALCLKGRRYYTYLRFLELPDCEKFGTSLITKGFLLNSNISSDWLNNKVKENLVIKNGYNCWSLTSNGRNLSETLGNWSKDYKNLKELKKIENPFELIEVLKIKKMKYLPKECPESSRCSFL